LPLPGEHPRAEGVPSEKGQAGIRYLVSGIQHPDWKIFQKNKSPLLPKSNFLINSGDRKDKPERR
jgi:hypothetical protein